MDFIVITYKPSRQGFMGPVPEEITISEAEIDETKEGIDELKDRLHVPLGGYVMIAEKSNVTIVKSRIVNEITPTP